MKPAMHGNRGTLAGCLLLGLWALGVGDARAAGSWQDDVLRDRGQPRRHALLMPRVSALLAQAPGEETAVTPPTSAVPYQGPRRWYHVAASAVVPGLGEVLGGHRRGFALIALDAGSLYGAYTKNEDGDDFVTEYKAYADAHYSEEQWAGLLLEGVLAPYFPNQNLVAGTVRESVALYVSREEDEREWYENIGKWDVFAFGWEEYGPPQEYLPDVDNPVFATPTRTEYINLRVKSKDAYEDRDLFISASLLMRVFSLLQTAYLEGFVGNRYKDDASSPQGAGDRQPPQVTWFVSPWGSRDTRIGLEVRY